jgi:tRNA(Arg) A34 adenosine deaminase TadA
MCLAAIYWARIDAIFFGNTAGDAARAGFDDSFLYAEIPKPHTERSLPIEPLLSDEARSSFEEWQKSNCRIDY